MPRENLVIFKGEVDGLLIILDEEARFEELLICLVNKLEQAKKFFEGAKIVVRFKGRTLEEFEKECILELLVAQNIVEIVFLHPFDDEVTERIKPQELPLPPKKNTKSAAIKHAKKFVPLVSNTYYHVGILRSGQEIVHEGSVIIMGDVNRGAVIRASESIIILGMLKGRAFAGTDSSKKKPFIIAYGMNAEQIGIMDHIINSVQGNHDMCAQIAYITEDKINIEEIDFKSLQNMIE